MDSPITDPSRLLLLPAESSKSPELGKSSYVTVEEWWFPSEAPTLNVCAYFRDAKGNYRLYELRHTFVSR